LQIQTFQSARNKQLETACFGENNFVHSLGLIHREHGVTNRARNDLAVRQLKLEILLAPLDPDSLQSRRLDPGGLGTRVDPHTPNGG
jgi:hypothetical protein